jgi:hypothetical protein
MTSDEVLQRCCTFAVWPNVQKPCNNCPLLLLLSFAALNGVQPLPMPTALHLLF